MKILCIDGGGIRGVFAVAILQAIEKEFNGPVCDLFDMVAGTSTGSIIASSVTLNQDLSEMQMKYKKYGKKIFKRQAKLGIFKSVYSDRYMREYFQEAYQNIGLSQIKKPLLIPSVNVSEGRPYVYRSNYGNIHENDLSIKLWDAVLSSCSAPIYFPPNNISNKYLSADGGLWANNPSLVCLTEAIHFFKKPMNEIKILSIGTGQQKIDFKIDKEKSWGLDKWLPFKFMTSKVTPKLLDLAMHLSSESVSEQCEMLLGDNYLRLNEDLGKEVPFDDIKYIDELIALGNKVIQEEKDKVMKFLEV